MKYLGEFLKNERERRNLSLRKFATTCGISHSYLDSIEKGRDRRNGESITPTLETLTKLARGLNMPLGDFLTAIDFADDIYATNKELYEFTSGIIEEELAQKGVTLSETEKTSLQAFVSRLISRKARNPLQEMDFDLQVTTRVPVLGTVACGTPIYADQNLIDYEDMPESAVRGGEYFLLVVKGESMTGARILPGDKVLIRRQDYVEGKQIALVIVNGEDATLKRVKFFEDHVVLLPDNPNYEPLLYHTSEVQIIGRAVRVMFDL